MKELFLVSLTGDLGEITDIVEIAVVIFMHS